jgi:hypothetical protein
MNALHARDKSYKIVGCVRIAIIFSFAKNVSQTRIALKVYMRIHINNIMFSPKFFDLHMMMLWHFY